MIRQLYALTILVHRWCRYMFYLYWSFSTRSYSTRSSNNQHDSRGLSSFFRLAFLLPCFLAFWLAFFVCSFICLFVFLFSFSFFLPCLLSFLLFLFRLGLSHLFFSLLFFSSFLLSCLSSFSFCCSFFMSFFMFIIHVFFSCFLFFSPFHQPLRACKPSGGKRWLSTRQGKSTKVPCLSHGVQCLNGPEKLCKCVDTPRITVSISMILYLYK